VRVTVGVLVLVGVRVAVVIAVCVQHWQVSGGARHAGFPPSFVSLYPCQLVFTSFLSWDVTLNH
jgi:hypothetical protein